MTVDYLFGFGLSELGYMKNVYLAAPFFSEGERDFNCKLRDELEGLGMSVFLPQEHSNDTNTQRDARQERIFSKNVSTS